MAAVSVAVTTAPGLPECVNPIFDTIASLTFINQINADPDKPEVQRFIKIRNVFCHGFAVL
jgi:hypothetical protein